MSLTALDRPHATRWRVLQQILWAAAFVCLPFTSFPLLANLTGAIVAPLSAVPILLLTLAWLLPYLVRRGNMPREVVPLLVFCLWAVAACALAFFGDFPSYKDRTIAGQELRALFTLAIGLAFYLTTSAWWQEERRLNKAWQWINLGGAVTLLWAFVQAYFSYLRGYQYPSWLETGLGWLVVQLPDLASRGARLTGFTYEPSWFAHQMVMLYLPLWLAAAYQRTSAFSFRFWRLTIEHLLLILGLVVFFLSSPRVGLISLSLVLVFLFLKLNLSVYRRLVQAVLMRRSTSHRQVSKATRSLVAVFSGFLFVLAYTIALFGVILLASRLDWRFALLVNEPPTWLELKALLTLDENIIMTMAHRLAFVERVIYWLTGWHIFNQYPWVGVGLGNAGFFFLEQTPWMGWSSYEIRTLLVHSANFPNIKSMWMRLLAETGLVGFSIFLTWYYLLLHSARASLHSASRVLKTLALAGQLMLIAFLAEGFSIDSFAMPYLWVAAGLVSGVGCIVRRGDTSSQSPRVLNEQPA